MAKGVSLEEELGVQVVAGLLPFAAGVDAVMVLASSLLRPTTTVVLLCFPSGSMESEMSRSFFFLLQMSDNSTKISVR